jgi:hypothetical protein
MANCVDGLETDARNRYYRNTLVDYSGDAESSASKAQVRDHVAM